MARRRRRREPPSVSLFPFLSVLACVIGSLALLLAALAIGRLGGPSLERIRTAERYQALRAAVAAGEARLEEILAQLEQREAIAAQEEELGRRLAALGLSLDVPLEELARLAELLREAARVEAERQELERRRRRLAERSADIEEDLEARRRRQSHAPIIIDPTGLGPEWRPYLIECTSDYIELHRASGDFSVRIPADELPRSDDLRRFYRRARAIHDALVVFLIRPDGVETYQVAQQVADQHGVRNAKLPLPGDGALDFGRMGALDSGRMGAPDSDRMGAPDSDRKGALDSDHKSAPDSGHKSAPDSGRLDDGG